MEPENGPAVLFQIVLDHLPQSVLQQMRVQHDGEAVLAQTVLTHKLRKILHAENVKPAPDCGDLIELLFDQTSGQELEGF